MSFIVVAAGVLTIKFANSNSHHPSEAASKIKETLQQINGGKQNPKTGLNNYGVKLCATPDWGKVCADCNQVHDLRICKCKKD